MKPITSSTSNNNADQLSPSIPNFLLDNEIFVSSSHHAFPADWNVISYGPRHHVLERDLSTSAVQQNIDRDMLLSILECTLDLVEESASDFEDIDHEEECRSIRYSRGTQTNTNYSSFINPETKPKE